MLDAKWEYKIVECPTTGIPDEKEQLDAEGQDGWELVAIKTGRLVFKRPMGWSKCKHLWSPLVDRHGRVVKRECYHCKIIEGA